MMDKKRLTRKVNTAVRAHWALYQLVQMAKLGNPTEVCGDALARLRKETAK